MIYTVGGMWIITLLALVFGDEDAFGYLLIASGYTVLVAIYALLWGGES